MREILTVLAGLLVLALLAALIGPGFVDWRDYRSQIEARLTETLGVETRVGGGIGLRLLPSPVLSLQDVRIGGGSGASFVTAEHVGVEFALSALVRGEFRFADAQAEGATLNILLDEAGAVRWPQRRGAGLPAQASLDRLTVRRSALVWRDADKAPVAIAPISAELSASSLAGPWRIEGEAAGSSFRITTGVIEDSGRLRAKAFVTGEDTQLSFDGQFLLPAAGGEPGLEGAFTLAPGGAVALAGQVRGGARQLDISGLSFDIGGGAARLEGDGQYLPQLGKGSLALRARRLDADALATALGERPGFEHGLQALPGPFDIALDLDQLLWRGEDFSALALRGRLDGGGLHDLSASVRVAGALIGASGRADFSSISGRLNLKAEDARRVALALARAGLDPALADMVAGLGRIDAEAIGGWEEGRIGFQRLLVTGSSGLRLEGSGDLLPGRLVAKAALKGLDLNSLPTGANVSSLVGRRDLALDLSLTDARFRNAPPGTANLALRREGEAWRLDRFSVEGFGGVAVNGSGALLAEGGEISGRVRAPRFEALVALAGPLLPEQALQAAARLGDGLARLDAGFRVTRATAGDTAMILDGAAQAGRLAFEGRLDRSGEWSAGSLRFDLADRRQAFSAFGLPAPAQGGAGRFTLELGPQRLLGSLSGPGLSLVAERRGTEPARLVVQAEGAGQILPEGPARLLPEGVLDAHARLVLANEAVALDDLVANLGGASARGTLTLPREGAYRGRLALPSVDLRALLGASLGSPGARSPGAIWSSARFGRAAPLPDFEVAVETGALTLFEGTTLRDAKLTLRAQDDGLAIDDVSGGYGGGRVEGKLSLRREGGLAQLAGRIGLRDVDVAEMTGGVLAGKVSGRLDAGGSGESAARLIAGLSGAGSLEFAGARLSRFDPSAYAQVIAGTGEDASESDPSRLQDRLAAALDRDAWALGEVAVPFTLAGGLVRLQPFAFERSGLRAEASGTVDLRGLAADLRLSLKPVGPLPKGWPGEAPQIAIAWRGPLSGLRRESDVGALSNTVAARALAREIERVEAFEADARERAIHSRRLRAERETRENERRLNLFLKAEEERRLAEEKRAEEARRIEEARLAEEARRAEETRRAEQARLEREMRRRLEAEERMRAATPPASGPQPGPLILQGAPRSNFPEGVPAGQEAPALPRPLQIESVPRPLSRAVQPH